MERERKGGGKLTKGRNWWKMVAEVDSERERNKREKRG